MADRKISDLTALTTPASGDYLPIVDISEAAAASKNKRVTIQSLFQGIPVNVGIGTSSPTRILEVNNAPDTTNPTNGADFIIASPGLTPTQINSTTAGLGITGIGINHAGDYHLRSFWGVSIDKGSGNLSGGASNSVNADSRTFAIRQYAGGTTWNTQFCVNGAGRVGIGTSNPGANHILEIEGGQKYLAVRTNAGAGGAANPSSSDGLFFTWNRSNGGGESNIVYGTGLGTSPGLTFGSWNGTTYAEAIRIDSSGRLLVGTSSNSGGAIIQAAGSVQASVALRFPANSKNGATTRATAIETISTDGGTNTATVYADARYGANKWVFLAGFDSSGNAINSTTSAVPGATFVFCITDAAANFPTT